MTEIVNSDKMCCSVETCVLPTENEPVVESDSCKKRKIKSPKDVSTQENFKPPEFDRLFSQLFSTVLKGVGSNLNTESKDTVSNEKTKKELEKDNKCREGGCDKGDDESECDDESESKGGDDEGDEGDDEGDDDEGDDDEGEMSIKWKVFNKLLDSHLNITKSMHHLISNI